MLEDLARREGISFADLQIFLVLPSNEAIRQAVEAGAGATIISELVVARAVAEGSLRSVPLELPKRDFAMITHRDRQASLAQMALKAHLGAKRLARTSSSVSGSAELPLGVQRQAKPDRAEHVAVDDGRLRHQRQDLLVLPAGSRSIRRSGTPR